jgi:hypothetical protein
MNKNLKFLTVCHNVNPIGEVIDYDTSVVSDAQVSVVDSKIQVIRIAQCPKCLSISRVRWTNVD